MAINSKQKGRRGELEFSHWIMENWGVHARRGQQWIGHPDAPDIQNAIPEIHIEVKRVEALNINKAILQACRDAGAKIPIVAHRRNRTPWLITIMAEDAIKFARTLIERTNSVELFGEDIDVTTKF